MIRGDRIHVASDTSPKGGHEFVDQLAFDRMDATHVYGVTDNGVTVGIPLVYVKRIEAEHDWTSHATQTELNACAVCREAVTLL